MKRTYLILFLLQFSLIGNSQVKLNPDIRIDTLRIWMDYSTEIEIGLQEMLQGSVTKGIARFNAEHEGFIVLLDSTSSPTSMRMSMGAINYVDTKDNLIWTGVGLITLAGHVYAVSSFGFTIPILLLRSTVSKVQIESSLNLVTTKPRLSRFYINPFGMYRKQEKQNEKMVKKTEKVLYRFLKELDRQEVKNKRP